jgi:hypothetical protein
MRQFLFAAMAVFALAGAARACDYAQRVVIQERVYVQPVVVERVEVQRVVQVQKVQRVEVQTGQVQKVRVERVRQREFFRSSERGGNNLQLGLINIGR